MRCPYCSHIESKVTDKRDADLGLSTRRRRECLKCRKRFTTYERIEMRELYVIKKDGRRELFSREKLRAGISKACEKRPVSQEKIDKIVSSIEEKLRKRGKEVKSSLVGEMVMKALKGVDKIAYIRFASVYREFTDVKDFKKEIQTLQR